MIEKKQAITPDIKAVLIGLIHQGQSEELLNEYLDELAFLAETAGALATKRFTQKLAQPNSRTFVGKGKLEEIKKFITGRDIELALYLTLIRFTLIM